jgi:hypothetical protein
MPASAASRIASAANGAGTKMQETLAAVSRTASPTVLNTGIFCESSLHNFAAAARGDAADEFGPVLQALLGVEFPGGAGNALDDQARIGVDQNAHGRTGACFSCTTAIKPAMRKLEFFHWNVSTEVSCSASSYSCKNPSTSLSGISTTSGRSTFS